MISGDYTGADDDDDDSEGGCSNGIDRDIDHGDNDDYLSMMIWWW